jgi:hypothetical protein
MRGKWWIVFVFAVSAAVAPRPHERSTAAPSAVSFADASSEPETRARGPDLDCRDFASHAEAQAFFEDNDPAEDPHRLDGDGDGYACEDLW